jgi:hypothetical protein
MKGLFLIFIIFFSLTRAQTKLITVSDGSFMKISGNTSFFIDNLTITPSDSFIISHNLFVDDKSHISKNIWSQCIPKVYTFSQSQNHFKGGLTFHYNQDELEGIVGEDLYIAMRENTHSSWFFNSSSTQDLYSNKINVNYSDDLILGQITLAYHESPLVFPNPFLNVLKIKFNAPTYKRLYDLNGVFYFQTEEDTLNLTEFSSGTYFLEIIKVKTGERWYHKIVKY